MISNSVTHLLGYTNTGNSMPGAESWKATDITERQVWKTGIRITLRGIAISAIIYKISGVRKVAMGPWTWWGQQKSQGHRSRLPGHGKWRKACINICKHIELWSSQTVYYKSTNN